MPRTVKRSRQRRGNAVCEFAILAPFLVMLLLGTWEVGRLVQVRQILANAAREGARQAATGRNTDSDVQTVVCQYLKDAGLPDYTSQASSVVTVTDVTSGGDVSDASQGDQIRVTVSIPFNDVRWVALYLVTNANTRLNAEADWVGLMDEAYPGTITSPAGF
jgi:Flp pilus assembly protein TadG